MKITDVFPYKKSEPVYLLSEDLNISTQIFINGFSIKEVLWDGLRSVYPQTSEKIAEMLAKELEIKMNLRQGDIENEI